ncbi:GNAT family N-acetyltransferase [Paenisporosarcina cavernae]|uniref:GNAT family N-acetyltransferase n=1 Tax=Paenisporosarcina cavernae TaxID=2320858 RepID=A0A385YU76_9BACL|nr:GNAT family N-acetyltransferase [Paenisporosarcina cavernae]AYC30419.1 GNAT family N-acetyltransferase [Paenisporosarcina cavernae]
MLYRKIDSANEMFQLAKDILQKREDLYSLFAGVLNGIQEGKYSEYHLGCIEEEGEILAFFQMTPPHPLHMIIIEDSQNEKLLQTAVDYFVDHTWKVFSVIGEEPYVSTFAKLYALKTKQETTVLMEQGFYRIDHIEDNLVMAEGKLEVATSEDQKLIETWYTFFEQDTGLPVSSSEDARNKVKLFISNEEVFKWIVNGETVAVAKKSRPSANGITVSFVFTPKKHRKKGYARTLVAKVTEELLRDYRFCVLFTDLSNPTSNKIYQEIGYRKIADTRHLGFQ